MASTDIPAPTCYCTCPSCYPDAGVFWKPEAGPSGGPAGVPVNLFTGNAIVTNEAHSSEAPPFGFGVNNELSYGAAAISYGFTGVGGFGYGWLPHDLAKLHFESGRILYPLGPNQIEVYDEVSPGVYQAAYYVRSKLTVVSGGYRLNAPDGSSKEFNSSGNLTAIVNPYGHRWIVNYNDTTGVLEKISQREDSGSSSASSGSEGLVEYLYEWDGDGDLTSITYKVSGGFVRRTEYSYNPKKLQFVVVYQASPLGATASPTWVEIETMFYTYHASGEKAGLLRHVVLPDGCKQMIGAGIVPLTDATEEQLNTYAAIQFKEYDGDKRVTKVATTGDLYNYDIDYAPSAFDDDFNNWKLCTTVTQKDGATALRNFIFYFNFAGQLMGQQVNNAVDPEDPDFESWDVIYQKFEDGTGRRIMSADASSIVDFNPVNDFLAEIWSGAGLVRYWDWDANGNLNYEATRQGASGGTLNKLVENTWVGRAVSGYTIYKVQSRKVYLVEGSTLDYALTTWEYMYFDDVDTFQLESMTITLPAVGPAENGNGIAPETVTIFNEYGFQVSSTDERGIVTNFLYDNVLGVSTRLVRAVGETEETVTDYTPDILGRIVLEEGPVHEIDLSGSVTGIRRASWTYYRDAEDEIVSFRGYIKTSDASPHAVNPIHIRRTFETPVETGKSGWRMESSIDAIYDGMAGIPDEDYVYARGTWVRWGSNLFEESGQQKLSRLYWNIPDGPETGTKDDDYGETEVAYDLMSRPAAVTTPGGTIQSTVFNVRNWPLQQLIGTSLENLVVVSTKDYNTSGYPVTIKAIVDSDTNHDRTVSLTYDYRHRVTKSQRMVEKDPLGSGDWTLIDENTYDNRDNVLIVQSFHTSVSNFNRTAYSTTSFDARNRLYRQRRYGVLGSSLEAFVEDNTFYDAAGNPVRRQPAGSEAFTVTDFDALSRPATIYTGYESDEGNSSSSSSSGIPEPSDISGAVIVEQTETKFDRASNVIQQLRRQRFDDATGFGALMDPTHSPKARVYYSGTYPDAIGRIQAMVDAGTNQGSNWPRPDEIPNRSDVLLINSNTYDGAGNTVQTQDPEGVCTCWSFDKARRVVELIENCMCDGSSSSSSGTGGGARTTRYEYTPDSLLAKLRCENPSTGEQVTEWEYDVKIADGSALNSHLLVSRKIYPHTDSASSSSSSSGACDVNAVEYLYNRAGQVTRMTDRACTRHDYTLDKLGRLTADQVTLPSGSEIDDRIDRLEYGYDNRLLLTRVSSLKTTDFVEPIQNEVRFGYNAFHQLSTEYQQHEGPVDTSTSRKLQYRYGDGESVPGVVNNSVRPFSMKSPSDSELSYLYASESAAKLSRVDTLWLGSSGAQTGYRYLGLSTFVAVNYSAPGVGLTYARGSNGDGGDQYKGLDRFGRPVDLRWVKATDDYKVQAQYGYDRASNALWRRDLQAHTSVPPVTVEDHMYWYDNLYQITQHERGTLTGGTEWNPEGIASPSLQTEQFGYDETGNWLNYDTTGGPALTQDRIHTKTNEILSISNAGVGGVIQPLYDPAGNMTRMPKPSSWTEYYAVTWDAWNRPVEVADSEGLVAAYAYDGLCRRVTKTVSSEVRHFYYTKQWQVCETYLDTDTTPYERLYWGLGNINDLMRRQRDSNRNSSLDEDLYSLADTMNVVATCDDSGNIVQRFAYYAFGTTRFLEPGWNSSSNINDWSVLFHGQCLDVETLLYQMRFRYFHSRLGRWVSTDLIGELGGFNLYAAFRNRPVGSADLLGLCDVEVLALNRVCPTNKPFQADEIPVVIDSTELWREQGFGSRAVRAYTLADGPNGRIASATCECGEEKCAVGGCEVHCLIQVHTPTIHIPAMDLTTYRGISRFIPWVPADRESTMQHERAHVRAFMLRIDYVINKWRFERDCCCKEGQKPSRAQAIQDAMNKDFSDQTERERNHNWGDTGMMQGGRLRPYWDQQFRTPMAMLPDPYPVEPWLQEWTPFMVRPAHMP